MSWRLVSSLERLCCIGPRLEVVGVVPDPDWGSWGMGWCVWTGLQTCPNGVQQPGVTLSVAKGLRG
jgi:hypothetical protein